MLDNIHGLVNLVSNLTVLLLVVGGLAAIVVFLRVFRSDFDQLD
ncbi:MAG TPA: hypothetical protein V6D08_08085 [Candidatus Obscuribacterales bacterium]